MELLHVRGRLLFYEQVSYVIEELFVSWIREPLPEQIVFTTRYYFTPRVTMWR